MKLHLPLLITALTSSINATLSEQYGAPVILHTDHCAKKLLPWVDGLLSASERYHAEHGEPLFSSHMIDLSEEPIEENIDICKSYLERFAKMGMLLEMELGITGGEEDGVNNEDVPLEDLYPKPEEIYMVYDELSKISDQFTVAAAFGNVHGVFSPGNVKLEPKILTRAQAYISDKLQDKAPVDKKPVKFVFHGGSGTTSDTNPNGFEVPVFSDGRRNSVSISLILLFGLCFIMIVVDHQNLQCYLETTDLQTTESPKLINAKEEKQQVLNSCDTHNQCPIRKEVCLTNQLIDLYHVHTGVVYTIPESNMNVSNLKAFATCLGRPGFDISLHVSSSHRITKSNHSIQIVEGILQRTIKASRDQIKGMRNDSNGIVVFPAYGQNSMFGEKTRFWLDYTTAFLVGEEVCFWPQVAPKLASNETDASFLMSDNRTKNAVHKQTILISGGAGYFDSFWHAMFIFNQWCQFRHQQDVSLVVQTAGPSIKPFVYDMASALEIDKSRIIHHDRPIIAETILTATLTAMETDWSCLHGALKKDNDRTIALVYQRPGKDPTRDISPDIHSELVNELSVALGIPVKTFNGTGSLDDTRELFSSAKIVIGPHGAGLANLIFVSSHWVPVIEYITHDLLNRPWQLYGGGSFGLPWFPVLLSSFENRDEIMKSVHVAKEALLIAEERSGNFP